MQQLQMRMAALPAVQSAATGWAAILSGGRRAERIVMLGKQPSEQEETFCRISPGYFATLRTPLLSGRDFEFRDNDNEPVPTIVNRAFASRYFGSEDAVGREFRRTDGVRHQVVGIAADSHYGDLHGGPEPIAYMPMKPPRAFVLYVRSTLDSLSVAKVAGRESAALGGGMRVVDATPLPTLVGNTMLKERLLAGIGGACGFLGLILAAIGIFGLLNYAVVRRTREIGIRAALGARRLEVVGLVMRDLLGVGGAGLAMGLAVALVLMRFAGPLLFEIQPADPLVFGTALAIFVVTSVLAAGIPARRAAAIDPVIALRNE
jgi:hypothetical protein